MGHDREAAVRGQDVGATGGRRQAATDGRQATREEPLASDGKLRELPVPLPWRRRRARAAEARDAQPD